MLKTLISTDDEDDESGKLVSPHFNESVGFGEVHLEAGMKFYTFPKFKEVVRDYTIHMEERKSE
jgi:hypothetical protein